MKIKKILTLILLGVQSSIFADPAFTSSLPCSCTNSNYAPFLGEWKISTLGDEPLSEPVKIYNSQVSSNRMQATVTQGREQTTTIFCVASFQGNQFVNFMGAHGFNNIFLIHSLNSGKRIELMTMSESQVEMDITNSIIAGQVFEHSRGLKHFQISAGSGALTLYLTNRIDAFTNKWLVLDKVN